MYKKVMLGCGLVLSPIVESQIPEKYSEVDSNGNGQIEVVEIQTMIDGFFIGLHDRDAMYMHDLIDFYFEQD